MTRYRITLPAFSEEIEAVDEKEALEIFWFDFDRAHQDAELTQPEVKEISKRGAERFGRSTAQAVHKPAGLDKSKQTL